MSCSASSLDGNENGNKADDGPGLSVFFIPAKGTFDEQPQLTVPQGSSFVKLSGLILHRRHQPLIWTVLPHWSASTRADQLLREKYEEDSSEPEIGPHGCNGLMIYSDDIRNLCIETRLCHAAM
jgi:hypothetical protein